jgi:hypothetical protein
MADRSPFEKLKTWFECVEERDAEIVRLRAALERAQGALLSATDGDQYSEHMDTLKQIDEALRPNG